MKKLYKQAIQIAIEAQMITDSLVEYNLGFSKNKTPLKVIQYDIVSLIRELKDLHKKIKKETKV